jgi:hypothetical protein
MSSAFEHARAAPYTGQRPFRGGNGNFSAPLDRRATRERSILNAR